MRVRLKGINSITKRLADGNRRTYWYAWKGGPPLRGQPGSPEFIASYNEAAATKVAPPRGTLLSVLHAYQLSDDFLTKLAPRSRADYIGKIKLIEKSFGDFPLAALADKRTRGIFKEWRERLAVSSAGRPTMPGWYWPAFCHGAWTEGSSPRTLAPGAVGFIAAREQRTSGALSTKRHSWNLRRRTCICPCYSLYGPASGRATCCGFRGPPMTVLKSGCDNRRVACALPFLLARRSRLHSTPQPSARQSF